MDDKQISDIILSEKDIIQDKDNSIINKSILSTEFSFPELIDEKNILQIKLESSLEFQIQITSKSMKKIISLISDNNQDLLENNYLDYITCLIIASDELDKQQLLSSNNINANIQSILEPTFYELLKRTEIYYIDIIPKQESVRKKNKIILKSDSLKKIASFLNKDIFDISDFIVIEILSYQDKKSFNDRFLLREKFIGKFSHSSNENIFMGKKNFPIEIQEAKKCERINLQIYDYYFINVWNAIENDNFNEDKLSFSGSTLEKFNNEEIGNRKNILPNSNDINKSRENNRNRKKNDEIVIGNNACAESFCGNLCKIF